MDETITVEEGLKFVQSLLEQKGSPMNDDHRNIFKGIWISETNEQLAERLGLCTKNPKNLVNIDKHYVYKLIKLLKVLGEDIRRNNLKEVVQREYNNHKQKLEIYVERPPLEKYCYQVIEQPLGGMIRIQAPQRMGKSKLMRKIIYKYACDSEQKYLTVRLDFQDERSEIFSNYDRFLQWFFRNISQNLQQQNVNFSDNWLTDGPDEHSKINYSFSENILKKINNQILVLALRKIDRVFPLDFASDFLSLLRGWYDKGQDNDSNWGKLKLILMYSKECQVEFPEGLSPFNVGHIAQLREFNKGEISNFAQQNLINLDDDYIEKLMLQVGGHPYLISKIITQLKTESIQEKEGLEKVISSTSLIEELFQQHLDEDIWKKLTLIRTQNSDAIYNLTMITLKNLLENQQVVREYDEDSEKVFFILDSLGLVKIDRDEKKQDVMKIRNNLYHEYLSNKLLKE